jgi:hypothetical protein
MKKKSRRKNRWDWSRRLFDYSDTLRRPDLPSAGDTYI